MCDIIDFTDPGYSIVALNITKSLDMAHKESTSGTITDADILARVQVAWVASEKRISKTKLVLPFIIEKATGKRLVVGAFVPNETDGWKVADETYGKNGHHRMMFAGRPVSNPEVRSKYVGKSLPDYSKAARNPVKYFDSVALRKIDKTNKLKY